MWSGGSHDESCSSPWVHDAWLRLRHRQDREIATNREITYVEEKGTTCVQHAHRRNHTIAASKFGVHTLSAKAS